MTTSNHRLETARRQVSVQQTLERLDEQNISISAEQCRISVSIESKLHLAQKLGVLLVIFRLPDPAETKQQSSRDRLGADLSTATGQSTPQKRHRRQIGRAHV